MLEETIRKLAQSQDLTLEEAREAFFALLNEDAQKEQIAAFLLMIKEKGAKPEEVAGAAQALRAKLIPCKSLRPGAINISTLATKNTGTFNVDIATAFVVAGCGVPVVKNYLNPLHTASKDVETFKSLGINLKLTPAQSEKCFNDIGVAFFDITTFLSTREILENALFSVKTETIFDFLSVLVTPFPVRYHFIGAGEPDYPELIARTCAYLDIRRAMAVRGEDNLDVITTCDRTKVSELNKGEVSSYFLGARDFATQPNSRSELLCSQAESAAIIKAVLTGQGGDYTNIVLVNAAAALVICGIAESWPDGLEKARRSLKQGRALSKFKNVQNWTRSCKN